MTPARECKKRAETDWSDGLRLCKALLYITLDADGRPDSPLVSTCCSSAPNESLPNMPPVALMSPWIRPRMVQRTLRHG